MPFKITDHARVKPRSIATAQRRFLGDSVDNVGGCRKPGKWSVLIFSYNRKALNEVIYKRYLQINKAQKSQQSTLRSRTMCRPLSGSGPVHEGTCWCCQPATGRTRGWVLLRRCDKNKSGFEKVKGQPFENLSDARNARRRNKCECLIESRQIAFFRKSFLHRSSSSHDQTNRVIQIASTHTPNSFRTLADPRCLTVFIPHLKNEGKEGQVDGSKHLTHVAFGFNSQHNTGVHLLLPVFCGSNSSPFTSVLFANNCESNSLLLRWRNSVLNVKLTQQDTDWCAILILYLV